MKLFTSMKPNPVGEILGTGFKQFHTTIGIDGLGKISDDRFDLLAVATHTPGRGQFREFISQCKERFNVICVWEVWNPQVESALRRYGFTPETEIAAWGQTIKGFRWDKPLTNELVDQARGTQAPPA